MISAVRGVSDIGLGVMFGSNIVAIPMMITVAFIPLALVTVPVENIRLYVVNMVFVAVMPAAYAALVGK